MTSAALDAEVSDAVKLVSVALEPWLPSECLASRRFMLGARESTGARHNLGSTGATTGDGGGGECCAGFSCEGWTYSLTLDVGMGFAVDVDGAQSESARRHSFEQYRGVCAWSMTVRRHATCCSANHKACSCGVR